MIHSEALPHGRVGSVTFDGVAVLRLGMVTQVPQDLVFIRGAKTLRRLVTLSSRSLTRQLPPASGIPSPRIGVVVPTSAERQQLLNDLLPNLDLSRFQVVVVATSAGVDVPPKVPTVEDRGGINIQRWWNRGLDHLVERGCDIAVVMNDDVRVSQDDLESMAVLLAQSRATMSSPGPSVRWFRHGLPLKWRMDGALWAINLHHGLRPDERYQWWMGDRDLEVRARTEFGGLLTVPVTYQHIPGSQTTSRLDLQELADQDMSIFGQHHAAVTRAMKYMSKVLRREQYA